VIQREHYLRKLRKNQDKQIIKVITGIRRCGKSTLLKLFQQELIKAGVEGKQLIHINFEDMDNSHLLDPSRLHEHIKENLTCSPLAVFVNHQTVRFEC